MKKSSPHNFFLGDIKQFPEEAGMFYLDLENVLNPIINSKDYDNLVSTLNVRLPNAPKNSDEQLKKIKENISNTIKEIKSICIYESLDEIKNSILLTKNYAEIIIEKITNILRSKISNDE